MLRTMRVPDILRDERRGTLVELGAGTGKFTRVAVDVLRSWCAEQPGSVAPRYIAVEPSAFLENIRTTLPSVECVTGSAEHLPLPSNSAAGVIAAQAFHWFATPRALREMHRVLKPDGFLGLVWNTRDPSLPHVRAVEDIIDSFYDPTVPRQQTGKWKEPLAAFPGFGPYEHTASRQVLWQSRDSVVDRVLSISVVARQPEAVKDGVRRKIHRILDEAPTNADGLFELPYVTDLYLCRKRPM